ncbi:hypothetical protein [Paenibacillus sp. FSL H7-689]|uniref:hypothetical protein n=1 Tax=Paenibacillus sp. FSL H7-689 TaxID=1227349 RepID=UPI0003E25A99|nr:hypothetical protein [Paenibacillus sp. FSL H7-689]ETT46744.1 hypothetical protein C170_21899 [Paenibacillus sp. FSL H7-689]
MSFLENKSKKDYSEFKEFISGFTVNTIPQNSEQYIRLIHKNLFKIHFFKHCAKIQDIYLTETISDILSFAFLSRIGTHKASMVVLRSSIENYMRSIVNRYLKKNEIIHSTMVLPLFEETKKYFQAHDNIVKHINKLYSIYSYLCSYSHSATRDFHESHIVFQDLTKISFSEIQKASKECEKTIQSMLYILYYLYYLIDNNDSSFVHNQHRNEFIELLPDEILSLLTQPI